MATRTPDRDPLDYRAAEALDEPDATPIVITAADVRRERVRREWLMIGVGLAALVAIMAAIVSVFALTHGDHSAKPAHAAAAHVMPPAAPAPAADAAAPTLADAKGIASRSSSGSSRPAERPYRPSPTIGTSAWMRADPSAPIASEVNPPMSPELSIVAVVAAEQVTFEQWAAFRAPFARSR